MFSFARKSKEIHTFLWYFARFALSLTSSKILSLENEKKSELSFCILLAYSYLCKHKSKNNNL